MKINKADARRRAALSLTLSALTAVALSWLSSPAPARGAASLPDNRAYEQVSPVDKEGADVEGGPTMAALDGNRLLFSSKGSFAGQPTTLAAEASSYMSTRGPGGWRARGISLPNGSLTFGSEGYVGFTPDMSKGVINWNDRTRFGGIDPLAQPGFNQYLLDSASGSFTLVNGTNAPLGNNLQGFMWGSADFHNLALQTTSPLLPGTPCATGKPCAWESEGGELRLASVLPGGEAVSGVVGNGLEIFGASGRFEHAMSDDGARLFFTSLSGEGGIYARENGSSTSLVSGSERTLPGGEGGNGVTYQSAEAAHGDKVLFTTKNSLVDTDTDTTNDLYMYDFTKPAGERLTVVSADESPAAPEGASVRGFVGASEDLRRAYFVADNQIVAGGPEGAGPKLYLWEDTGGSPQTTYVATLDPTYDSQIWSEGLITRRFGSAFHARWSRDGRYLAFISRASLAEADASEGSEDIYRYDALSGSLECATCVVETFPAQGEVTFQPTYSFMGPVNHLSQNVSDSGQVFFQTTRGLLRGDSNGQADVYEYDGRSHLISKGTGESPSTLLDATPSGSDVFFTTRDRLVGWDKDSNIDAYDARVDGGFPEPGFVPPPCEGEACLAAALAPSDPTPSSASFQGPGDPTLRKHSRCAKARKGKVRKGRCAAPRQRHHRRHTTPSHR